MKNLRNKNAPPLADLIQTFIDSAYDAVKYVSDNIPMLQSIATWLALGNDYVLESEMTAAIDAAVAGLYDHKGGYDAATNTPDLDSAPSGVKVGDAYTCTVAGPFFGSANLEVGDVIIANIDGASQQSDWTIVNKNIDDSAFATAAQGVLADAAIQAADISSAAYQDVTAFATSGQGVTADTALQPADLDTLAKLNALIGDATLGDEGDFASSAQGDLADSALQSASINTLAKLNALVADATLGDSGDFATAAQGTKADDAMQFADDTKDEDDMSSNSATHVPTQQSVKTYIDQKKEMIIIAVSDETTDLIAGTGKLTFRMGYAFTLTEVRASVSTAPTGSVLTVDINEGGSSILSTKLTIDATEKTSKTAATAAVISDASLADDAEITIDIDTIGSGTAGAGLKIALIGYKTP